VTVEGRLVTGAAQIEALIAEIDRIATERLAGDSRAVRDSPIPSCSGTGI
jgi:hypothetical protein